MADNCKETPTTEQHKFGKFGEFVKKNKTYIIAVFTAIVGFIAGDCSIQDAIVSLFK
jgi:hypothetical protein